MRDTYESLKQVANLLDVEEDKKLVKMYQAGQKRNLIVAKMYCDNIAYLVNRSSKYVSVDDDDKSSYALESIHNALSDYRFNTNASLTSLMGHYFENKLKNNLERKLRDKRKIDKEAISLEGEVYPSQQSDTKIKSFCTYPAFEGGGLKNFSDSYLQLRINESEYLSEKQKEVCSVLLEEKDQKKVAQRLELNELQMKVMLNSLKKVNLLEIIR